MFDEKKNSSGNGKLDIYLGILEEIGQNDKAYQTVIKKVKEGLDSTLKVNKKESDS